MAPISRPISSSIFEREVLLLLSTSSPLGDVVVVVLEVVGVDGVFAEDRHRPYTNGLLTGVVAEAAEFEMVIGIDNTDRRVSCGFLVAMAFGPRRLRGRSWRARLASM
jgi:hypothetical protein